MTEQGLKQAPQLAETPLWTPPPARARGSQMAAFMEKAGETAGAGFSSCGDLWRWSVDNPGLFWSAVWDFCGVIGDKGGVALENGGLMPGARFFPQARLNWAENLLRRRDGETALVFRDEKGRERTVSFSQLYERTSRWAQALKAAGVESGDRVAGYMPNMPETVIAALAAASIGAVWASASPDFGVQGLVDRFGQIRPKIMVAADGYFYNGKTIDCLDKVAAAQKRIPGLEKIVIVPFAAGAPDLSGLENAVTESAFLEGTRDADLPFVRVPFDHPLFIMFSSGTTGVPKCIVHGHGGSLLQHLKEHRLHCDIREGDRVFYFTTCGWMMWNWLVSALASGAALLLYDGSPFYPDGMALWRYTAAYGCTLFGTGAKYIDALKAAGIAPGKELEMPALRTITSTGSPLVHESFDYVYGSIRKDVHLASISGGTDILSCFVLGNPLLPVFRGEIQGPGLGMAVEVFDESGRPVPPGGGAGELVCTVPFPSMPTGFWNDPDGSKYKSAYFERFPGVWRHGDWTERTEHGGFIIHGRSDATLNPGGVRIGTAEIYRQVEQVGDVLESIAVGQDWDNDVRVVLFVRLKDGGTLTPALEEEIKKRIRAGATPRHVPAKIVAVADIPRTKSGKITELAVRDVIHGRPVRNVEALANPEALDLYRDLPVLRR